MMGSVASMKSVLRNSNTGINTSTVGMRRP